MERALLLTREYLLDVFRLSSAETHKYRWVVHAWGWPQPEKPEEWRDSAELRKVWPVAQVDHNGPFYAFKNEKALAAGVNPWSVTALQHKAAESNALGDGWFKRKVGVKLSMLGGAETTAYICEYTTGKLYVPGSKKEEDPKEPKKRDKNYDAGDTGLTEIPDLPPPPDTKKKEPEKRPDPVFEETPNAGEFGSTTIVAQRTAAQTVFVALHEPFEQDLRKVVGFRAIQQNERGVAVAVVGQPGSGIDDRLMVRLGDAPEEPITLAGDGESFTFADRAVVRIGTEKVEVSGDLDRKSVV
jgi:hypothetical protein